MNLWNPTADDKEKRRRLNRPSKRIRIKESRKFLLVVETRMGESFLVETGILGFAIRETAEGIRNPTKDWNPESKFHGQRNRNPVPPVIRISLF